MNPPRVYELTIPNSQRINSNTAIVQSIGTPFAVAAVFRFIGSRRINQQPSRSIGARRQTQVSSKVPIQAVSALYRKQLLRNKWKGPRAYGPISIDLNNPVAHRVKRKIRHRMQVEFAHEVGSVRFRGLYAEAKSDCNFLISSSFSDELDYFPLPRRQNALSGRMAFFLWTQIAIEHHLCHFRSEEGAGVP